MDEALSASTAKCAVCNIAPYGRYFGVIACRSCASFFRRTVFQHKVYKCRKNNKCDRYKEGMRNTCRACRLRECLRAGMRHEPKKVKVTLDLLSESPTLERYHMGFRNFLSGEKSLFLMENPEAIFSNPEYKPLKLAQWMRMEWGCVSLLHTLCVKYFQPFNELSYCEKVEILKQYWKYFQALYSAHLSASAVPYFEKSKRLYNMVLHYRYYLDLNTMREFFPQEAGCDPDKVASYCKPVLERASTYHAKYYDMKVTEMELIAMIAILFWNTVDKHNLLSAEMRHKRDAVFVEINSILLNSLGGINGSARLGNIISFLHMTMDRAEEVNELWVMAKVFLPKFTDPWDANVWKEIVRKE
ncbi:zinc finger, c4 type (two domains) domain-containing protein [Ditylenchus destructor]|uniref:Zinc finger, c4 type (Two domains) domain-containing protein n=1 Tax=Ditylenchus destructor TaxID=166010 RepID=A0AAD4MV13_9BILA|nr:zinc finger, c4 type (two domains) domain-containing protein [Ditylenchus destructor]